MAVWRRAKEEMERDKNSRLRHRIHQWSVSTLTRMLEGKPLHVVRVPERGSSSTDPFSKAKIKGYAPLVIRYAVKGGRRVRVQKIVLRIACVNGRILERDVVGGCKQRLEVPILRWEPCGAGLDRHP